jgi:hypothetical protein
MQLHRLIAELRRAADVLEAATLDPDHPHIRAGDVAQIRPNGDPQQGGKLVLVDRVDGCQVRASLLDVHRAGAVRQTWTTAQLRYIGTPPGAEDRRISARTETRPKLLAIAHRKATS